MKRLLAIFATSLALTATASADGKIYVQLPDLSGFSGEEAETFLSEVVLANVISSNCADFAVTDEEWSLLTDSADILAHGQLGIGVNDFDNLFYDPAFETLDEPGACDKHGPQVQPVIDKLVALGGSREALPDQEAAYQAEQARQLGWDAMALSSGKTKTK